VLRYELDFIEPLYTIKLEADITFINVDCN